MSNDKLDILGEAHLPSDLLTPTLSTNFLLDSYPDMEYGLGVLEAEQPPGSTPSPEYKITAFKDDAEGLHLDDFMREAGIQDLSWLDVSEQDPERLPKNPHVNAVPELEEAWGMNRREEGLHFYANVDLEQAKYEASLQSEAPSQKGAVVQDLQRVVRKAMRRSASGHGLQELLDEAATSLGSDASRVRSAMKVVQEEHGLAGNVFIRASAYPGYEKGKWNELFRHHAKSARYIIVSPEMLKGSVHIQNGYCTVTKKKAVTEVPWDDAFSYYAPKLKAAGYKVASGDKKAALRSAFLSRPEKLASYERHLPTHKAPSERVSLGEARRRFAAMTPEERAVYTHEHKRARRERQSAQVRIARWVKASLLDRDLAAKIVQADITGERMLRRATAHVLASKGVDAFSGVANDIRPPDVTLAQVKEALAQVQPLPAVDISHRPVEARRQKTLAQIARWARQGLLSEKDAQRLANSDADPVAVLHTAAALAKQAKEAREYSGNPNDVRVATDVVRIQDIWKVLHQAERKAHKTQESVDQVVHDRLAQSTRAARKLEQVKSAVGKVQQAISKGVRGGALRDFIARTIPRDEGSQKMATKMLAPVLRESGALEEAGHKTSSYQGRAYRQVPQRVATVSPHMREVEGMLRWVREAMNEGFAGKDLDDLIRNRFSSSVIKNGSEQLQQVRGQHEGAAGHLYIDASVYASKVGTKGCDKGALKHRANAVGTVLAMDRCAGCALRKVKADGTPVCTKYNKRLASESDLPDQIDHMKAANIKAANMTDQEATASLFAPSYDPSEFGLHNANLDTVDVPEHDVETISEVLFGGMEW